MSKGTMTVKLHRGDTMPTRYESGIEFSGWLADTQAAFDPWCYCPTLDAARDLALRLGFDGITL